jgi:hypothetical protein
LASSSSPPPHAAARISRAPTHQRRRWFIDMPVPLDRN